jgi:hypothetical protein
MAKLSVNINKLATLRNARGGNVPDILKAATDIQRFGAHGITIHPRPDERHIRYQDARDLKPIVYTEFNIEGNPQHNFIDLVLETKPDQVTLVPDAIGAITSNAGWDTVKHKDLILIDVIAEFKRHNIRTSIFAFFPVEAMIEGAKATAPTASNSTPKASRTNTVWAMKKESSPTSLRPKKPTSSTRHQRRPRLEPREHRIFQAKHSRFARSLYWPRAHRRSHLHSGSKTSSTNI